MIFQARSKTDVGWLKNYKEDNGIIISSRARLARNLTDKPFPHRSSKKVQEEIYQKLDSIYTSVLKNSSIYKISELDTIDKTFLVERHLISHEHASNKKESGVIITNDEKTSIMINEEDHLRIQVLDAGLSLSKIFEEINSLENQLSQHLDFAFNPKFGFLTACPTNVGTGLRLSCLLHLPALIITNLIETVINSLSKVSVNVRGFYGEGTRPIGDILQFSTSITLGQTEEKILDSLEKVIKHVTNYEIHEREKMFSNKMKKYKIEDQIYRAYATLLYAKIISSDETFSCLSKIRLGISLGLKFPNLDFNTVNQLMFMILPAHIQEIVNKELSPFQRDIARAELLRKKLQSQV